MINVSEIKRGVLVDLDDAPWQVLDCSTQTPSARGASTLTKIKIRNLKTGQVLNKSFRSGDMVQLADCQKRQVQFLYKDDDNYIFMDEESYDQFTLDAQTLGDSTGYLTDGLTVRSMIYNSQIINVELPNTVDLKITDTAPAIKGATAQAQLKPAILETGLQISVPPYLTVGERIKVDTRTCRFIERVK